MILQASSHMGILYAQDNVIQKPSNPTESQIV